MLQILTNGGSRIFLLSFEPFGLSSLLFDRILFHMLQNAMDVCIWQEMTDSMATSRMSIQCKVYCVCFLWCCCFNNITTTATLLNKKLKYRVEYIILYDDDDKL